jgi:hypothetical protein
MEKVSPKNWYLLTVQLNDCYMLLVVVKNPADFVGSYIGHSEANTKAILASTVGKVLIIDEVCFAHLIASVCWQFTVI